MGPEPDPRPSATGPCPPSGPGTARRSGPNPAGGSAAWLKLRWPLAALGLVLLFNLFFAPGFFHLEIKDGHLYGSLVDILNRASPVMLLALGMTLVIATGGVDLSVGAVLAIAGAVGALLVNAGLPVPAVIAIALAGALVAGLWNGALVGFLQVPPIVATLILMVSGRGLAQLLTNGQIVTFENKTFEFIGRGHFAGLPFTVTLVAIVFLLLTFATRRTAGGLFIEATGDNEVASSYAGVHTRLVKLLVYGWCGFCAGLAGLIVATDIKAADANNAGLYLELDAILAVVVGGTALSGGRISLAGSLLGAILIQTLTTTILTRGIPPTFTLVVKSAVIIIVCLLQSSKFRQWVLPRRAPAPSPSIGPAPSP
jgi:simple sugar transport system permease protein